MAWRGRVGSVMLGLGVALSCWCLSAEAQMTVGTGSGKAGGTAVERVVVLGSLPQAVPDAATIRTQRPGNGMTDEEWANRASRLLERSGLPSGGPATTGPIGDAPANPGSGGSGAFTPNAFKSFAGLGEAGLTPSDMGLAVNDAFVVQMVNARITVMDKVGNTQPGFPKNLATFFNVVGPSAFTDPRALYDWASSRWILIALDEHVAQGQGFLKLAVSQTNDPRGAYNIYSLQVGSTGTCPDYPTLGQSKSGIIVGINVFTCDAGGLHAFVTPHVLLFPKTQAYAGAALPFWDQFGFSVGGVLVDTLQPANIFDPADRPRAEFLVNSFNINFGGGSVLPAVLVWSCGRSRTCSVS